MTAPSPAEIIHALRVLQRASASDPKLLADAWALISASPAKLNGVGAATISSAGAPANSGGSMRAQMERIAEAAVSLGDGWHESADLIEIAGITRNQFTQLRKYFPRQFEDRPHPDHGKKKLYKVHAIRHGGGK